MPAKAQNKKISVVMKFWFPVFVRLAAIFLVSSIPQPEIPYVFTFQDILFHILAYLILAVFFLRALKNTSQNLSLLKILTITIFFCILYGISDEFHQLFVPGRPVSALDVLMDGAGSVLGSIIYPVRKIISGGLELS